MYENNDDMYDNPATEAVINFRWRKTRTFFILLFLRFIIFAICFGTVSWAYLVHKTAEKGFQTYLVAMIVLFYYLAGYLIITEIARFFHHGFKKHYSDFFNLLSIIIPTIVMSCMLADFQFFNGFESIKMVEKGLVVGITFSIFMLWIELILYLRLVSCK